MVLKKKCFIYIQFNYNYSNGERQRYNRKLLNSAFHYRILEKFLPIISEQQITLMSVIDKKVYENNGIIEDIRPIITMYVLDTLCGL